MGSVAPLPALAAQITQHNLLAIGGATMAATVVVAVAGLMGLSVAATWQRPQRPQHHSDGHGHPAVRTSERIGRSNNGRNCGCGVVAVAGLISAYRWLQAAALQHGRDRSRAEVSMNMMSF